MAPPPVRGRQLVKQRFGGLVFLVVLALLIGLTVALYQKAFTSTVTVRLQADRIGNQLTTGADVKARGVLVGSVRAVRATPDGAELELALDPDEAARVPADTRALILPKTLFGEKFVALQYPGAAAAPGSGLRDGAVIAQDRSATARETETALNDVLPLLQTLKPEVLSTTLNRLSSAVRGRGDRIGANLVLTRDYLQQFNPSIPTLGQDMAGVADFADTLTATEPDLKRFLDDVSAVNRNLVSQQASLDTFLRTSTSSGQTTRDFVGQNRDRFITLARESVPNLQVYARYSPEYPCLFDTIDRQLPRGEAFGGLQPGLAITLEISKDNAGYVPGDEPQYFDDGGPTCRGLVEHEVPFPVYRDGEDGYRDGQGVDPGTGRSDGAAPTGPNSPCTYPDQNRVGCPRSRTTSASVTPFSPASYDRTAVGATVAPLLGVAPDQVPDVAVMLFAPMARGTTVTVS